MSNFLGISLEPRARVEDRQVLPKCGTVLAFFFRTLHRYLSKDGQIRLTVTLGINIKIFLQDVFESLFFTIVSHRTSEAEVSRFKVPSTNA